jgi:ubiquinone biosynthesis protein COQ9
MAQAEAILRQAFNQISTHGFTRRAIAHSIPDSATSLSETAISALFGPGDAAQRTLIRAWLNEGRLHMSTATPSASSKPEAVSMEGALLKRLEWNEPVLPHLKDVRIT